MHNAKKQRSGTASCKGQHCSTLSNAAFVHKCTKRPLRVYLILPAYNIAANTLRRTALLLPMSHPCNIAANALRCTALLLPMSHPCNIAADALRCTALLSPMPLIHIFSQLHGLEAPKSTRSVPHREIIFSQLHGLEAPEAYDKIFATIDCACCRY